MLTYLNIVEMILSIVLIVVILLQTKGAGFSGTFSADTSIFRTRRGIEKTLFNFTIILAVIFLLVSVISVIAARTGPTA
ncbi:MAG: preprotein translocase subunit SecG [Chloroflexi bacterium]|nr:preprotein translocase subunit SecG [Chloroflexota bacterium]MCL5074714.1 preprotein translocase subunit SecG [Chloroflexota bacterium]